MPVETYVKVNHHFHDRVVASNDVAADVETEIGTASAVLAEKNIFGFIHFLTMEAEFPGGETVRRRKLVVGQEVPSEVISVTREFHVEENHYKITTRSVTVAELDQYERAFKKGKYKQD